MGIVGGLLVGWILSLFGFKAVVVAGMAQLFGVSINGLGYYFIFALLGVITMIIDRLIPKRTANIDLNDLKKKLKK